MVIASTPDTAKDMPGSPKPGQHVAPVPSLAQGTELIGEYEGSGFREPVFLVRRSDGQMIQLSRLVYLVASETDGQKDFGQIAERVSSEFGRTLSAENVRFLVENKLQPLGMIAANEEGPSPKLVRAKPVLALKFRVPILPRGAIRALAAVSQPLFLAPVVIAMLAGLAALDIWLFFVHGLVGSAQEVLYQPELFLLVFGLTLLGTLFHELGHATACHYGGAKPGRIGVGIYLVWPVFYNDVTDTYRLGKIGRLRTDLGGIYFDVIFTLAIAGAYFLTGSEWLLLIMFLVQLDMLAQFMPFVRLDGYYVVSDLTGVPDLFARITPILKSMIPGRETDRRVDELKPWVRVVVTVWVLTVIPTLLCVFGILIASAPQLYATAWDSFLNYQDKVQSAFGDGRVVAGVADLIRLVLLLVPVVGVTLLFLLVGKGMGGTVWSWLGGKPLFHAEPASALLDRESQLQEALKRTEKTYDELVQMRRSLGTLRAEEIRSGRDLGESGHRLKDLHLLARQAAHRGTELRHELLALRAELAEVECRRAAEEAGKATRSLEDARKAFMEAEEAAWCSRLEARRLAGLRDIEARRLEERRRPTPVAPAEVEQAVGYATSKGSGSELSPGDSGEPSGKDKRKGARPTIVILTLVVACLVACFLVLAVSVGPL